MRVSQLLRNALLGPCLMYRPKRPMDPFQPGHSGRGSKLICLAQAEPTDDAVPHEVLHAKGHNGQLPCKVRDPNPTECPVHHTDECTNDVGKCL